MSTAMYGLPNKYLFQQCLSSQWAHAPTTSLYPNVLTPSSLLRNSASTWTKNDQEVEAGFVPSAEVPLPSLHPSPLV